MFKHISLLVCLLGVALASNVSGQKSSEAESMLEAVKKHREDFHLCEDILGDDLKSCEALIEDLATLESDVSDAVSTATSIYTQGLAIMAEFTSCGTKSIFKQVACYESVVAKAKALAASAEESAQALQKQLTADVSQLESDLQSCVGSGYTSQLLNSKMAMCKLSLLTKN